MGARVVTYVMLWIGLALSTMCLAANALAHEVTPTIGELTVTRDHVVLDLGMNAEAFVAGVDLDRVEDINFSAKAEVYDILRALPPEDFEPQLRSFAEIWMRRVVFLADGARIPVAIDAIRVPPVGDVSLSRDTHLVLGATLPAGARDLTISWPLGAGVLLLRQQGVEAPYTGFLPGGTLSPPIPVSGGAERTGWSVFTGYIPVGFDHILPKGLDHILFVLGLFFLSTRLGPLLWQISAFTVAHTVTLALGALGHVEIDPRIVEPLIAASIVFVAVENVVSPELSRFRTGVVFGFGLLHGLGFASVLDVYGLPPGQFVPALLGFNIGVELGQLTVIAIAFLTVGFWFGQKPWYRPRIAIPASMVIALIGAWWFVERVSL